MNATAIFRLLLTGILAAMATLAIAQSSANFKSPAFAVNAGVGDMGSASFSARASVGQPFGAAALSSTNFAVTPGLLAIPLTTGTTGNLPVFNTGVAANRTLLPGGSVDPHYTLIASAEPTLPGPNAIVTTQIADGYWIPQGPNSKWIAPSANQSFPGANPCNAAGSYTYRTLIDLTGFDPATAVIQGQWAVDNQGAAIRLNGVSIGATQPGYNPFQMFTINSGFIAGVNTLDFVTSDQGCPNGLRVEILSANASIAASGPTIPGAPTNLTAVAGNAQATFTFTAPANNGGSPITSYRVDCNSPLVSASGATSPITVTGLTNGSNYSCVALAINALGNGPASSAINVTPSDTASVALTSVVSRKTHGATGDYELVVDNRQPVGGNITVEPRIIGAGHRIVFKFDAPVSSVGALVVMDSTGATIPTAPPIATANEVVVTLTGSLNARRVSISLTAINGTVNASAAVGLLVADVNNSGNVNAQDTSRIRARAGQTANANNFLYDITASGRITAADVVVSKVLSGSALP